MDNNERWRIKEQKLKRKIPPPFKMFKYPKFAYNIYKIFLSRQSIFIFIGWDTLNFHVYWDTL